MTGKREQGFVLLIIPIVLLIFLFVVVMFFLVILSARAGGAVKSPAPENEQPAPRDYGLAPVFGESPEDLGLDAGGAGLQCVNLPGVGFPRTPALDRRVARRYVAVKRELDEERISLTFTWGFRTTCQQVNVNPGGNLKARPGTSPHEAGRAVDVSGMSVRPDRLRIVGIFRAHNWRWLGMDDPPHFEYGAEAVGELSRIAMIRKNQAAYNAGQPEGGCRGTRCGQ